LSAGSRTDDGHGAGGQKTDEGLMVLLCQGQESALAELVRRYQSDIFRFTLHYLREADTAKDMTQETFVRVYTARDRFDASRKFRPWMLCIARNLCLNELKRKKLVSMETLESYASSAREESGEVLRFSGDGPDELMMAAERREMLARALDDLNEESRELITLRFFQRMSAKEIADIIGSTEGAVRTKLHRVLAVLREKHGHDREIL
jgi:RNA polymerase sigma-70 factor (ECF subfamily)